MHKLTDLGAFHLGGLPSFTCSLHNSSGKGRMFGPCREFCGHIWKWYTHATGPEPGVWPNLILSTAGKRRVSVCSGRETGQQWFSTHSPRSTESESTGILLEKKIRRLHHRPIESGARKSAFQRAPQGTLVHIKYGESGVGDYQPVSRFLLILKYYRQILHVWKIVSASEHLYT